MKNIRCLIYAVTLLGVIGQLKAEENLNALCQSYLHEVNSGNKKIAGELFFYTSKKFYHLTGGIAKGDGNCFKLGVAIADIKDKKYGDTLHDITEAYGTLLDTMPELFNELSRRHPYSKDFLLRIFEIPYWKVEQYYNREISAIIKKRLEYFKKYNVSGNNKLFGYNRVLSRLKKMSYTHAEYFSEDGARIVFSSPVQYLNSDKKYKLSNLLDDNKNTAWCVNYDFVDVTRPLISAVIYLNDFDCHVTRNRNKCYIEDLEFKMRHGYQKSNAVFKNNIRLKSINAKIKRSYKKIDGFSKEIKFSDELLSNKYYLPIDRTLDKYVRINTSLNINSLYEGSKYNDLCISDLSIKVRKQDNSRDGR